METNDWLSATELQARLSETEGQLKALQDEVIDLKKVRTRASNLVRLWPALRLALPFEADSNGAFEASVAFLGQAVRGLDSTPPPPPSRPLPENDAAYLTEVLAELYALAEEALQDGQDNAPVHVLKMHEVLKTALEPEANAPTEPAATCSLNEWAGNADHVGRMTSGSNLQMKPCEVCGGQGLCGKCGGNDLFAKDIAHKLTLGSFLEKRRVAAAQADIDRLAADLPKVDPMTQPRDKHGKLLRRTYKDELTYRQLTRDIDKLTCIGIQLMDDLGKMLPWEPSDFVQQATGYSAQECSEALDRRITAIELELGLTE